MGRTMEHVDPKGYADDIPVYCAFDEIVPVENVVPNPRNPNRHPQAQVELLARIIKVQGWRTPITISRRSGFIVRGQGRYLSALFNNAKSVPVDYQNYATEAEEWADMVADNRIAEFSELDEELIGSLLAEMDHSIYELTGYSVDEIEKLINSLDTVPPQIINNSEVDPATFDEERFDHICPKCKFRFND